MNNKTLNWYQHEAMKTAVFEEGSGDTYVLFGLVGEAGELANKYKKTLRGDISPEDFRKDAAKELGDCLWYLAVAAARYGYTLEEVAEMNIKKLRDRQRRGVLKGSGDNR